MVLVGSSGGFFAPFAEMRTLTKNPIRQGNLTVYAKPEYAPAVKAALRQLQH